MFDLLLQELISLNTTLRRRGVSMILGGGMGLFLRDSFFGGQRSLRYPVRPESRSTDDLDVLLTADLIVDAQKMNALRDVLDARGYEPAEPVRPTLLRPAVIVGGVIAAAVLPNSVRRWRRGAYQ